MKNIFYKELDTENLEEKNWANIPVLRFEKEKKNAEQNLKHNIKKTKSTINTYRVFLKYVC
jgi:hypothetical protein